MHEDGTHWVILDKWDHLRIWHDSVECAVDLFRDCPVHLQILNLAFVATWFHETRKLWEWRKALCNRGMLGPEMGCHHEGDVGNYYWRERRL